jgi:hypothetical protein
MKKQILAALLTLVVASLVITACAGAPAATPEPTMDPNLIITQAYQTVEAGMAMTQAAQPPTPLPSATPEPTATMDPAMAAALTATAQAVLQPGAVTTPTSAVALPTVAGQPTLAATLPAGLPTATSAVVAPPPSTSGDKAEWVAQSPEDGVNIKKSATFTYTLVLKNSGTTTWTPKYALAFYAGDRMGSPNDFNMPHEVKPNESVRLVFDMKAADATGKKRTIWAVRNAEGVNFYEVFLEVNVTD